MSKLLRLILLSLLVATGCIMFFSPTVHAQTSTVQLWYISFRDPADLNRLAGELDVWEVDHSTHQLLAPLTDAEVAALSQTHQVTLAPDQSPLDTPPPAIAQVAGIPSFACYRTVDESFMTLDQLALDYPQLVRKVDIGDSWDKDHAGGPSGDDMRVLVISNRQRAGPKFRFMLMGAIHAREYVTAELALRFAESLLQRYGHDAAATWLLDYGELHLLTFANPDGRRIAETGQLWRKNTNTDAACSIIALPSTSYGVDLNRNSSFHWNDCEGFSCSSADSCRETYRGVAPGSEPEVASIEAYMRSIFPDQRGPALEDVAPEATQGLFMSLHSYGRLALFPWGWTSAHSPNGLGLATLARRFGYPLDYRVCQAGGVGCLYQTDGTTDDWAYGELGLPSFTIEFGTAFFQSCSDFENAMVQDGLAALNYAFSAAPLPYQLASGPEVLNLAVSPRDLMTATHVLITATVDATRMAPLFGLDNEDLIEPIDSIQAARIAVDAFPWITGTATLPLSAIDGEFDAVQEVVTGTVEMACLPSGRHTLFVQAQDQAGDWGVMAAEFVTVTNTSQFTATVQNDQGLTIAGQPVTYTLFLTNTGVTTATYVVDSSPRVEIVPPTPVTLTAGKSQKILVVITPIQNSVGTVVPTLLKIRSTDDRSHCRQVQVNTSVTPWTLNQFLLIIRKS